MPKERSVGSGCLVKKASFRRESAKYAVRAERRCETRQTNVDRIRKVDSMMPIVIQFPPHNNNAPTVSTATETHCQATAEREIENMLFNTANPII